MVNSVIHCVSVPEQQKAFFEIFWVPIITTLIGTAFGAIIGSYFSYRYGVKLAQWQSFNIIGNNFRRAFMDELIRLESRESISVHKILEPAANKHMAAVFEFRQVLPSEKLAAFDKAWADYYYGEDQKEYKEKLDVFPILYSDSGCLDNREKNRENAIKRIKNLLSFADKSKK